MRAKYDETPQRNVLSYWVKFSTAGLVAAAEAGIRGHASIKSMPGSTTLARPKMIQVPASVLAYALPELVASFQTLSAVSIRKARARCSKPKIVSDHTLPIISFIKYNQYKACSVQIKCTNHQRL